MLRTLAILMATTVASHAATVTDGPADDAAFRALCQGCETAVGEIRGGGRGEWELDARAPSGPDQAQADFAIADGATYAFRVLFDATLDTLTVGASSDGVSYIDDVIAFSPTQAGRFGDTRSLFVRARARDWKDGQQQGPTRLTGLTLNGQGLGDLEASDGASYLAVSNFDFAQSFALAGSFMFDTTRTSPRSHYAAQFKFADLDVAPVPVPAAGVLLLAALGALGAARLPRG